MPKLTKTEYLVLNDYSNAILRATPAQLGVNPRVAKTLYNMGYLKACNWSRKPSEIDFIISPAGINKLKEMETEHSDVYHPV